MRDPLVDAVYIGQLSRETRRARAKVSDAYEWNDLNEGDKMWLTLEEACVLFFRMRHVDDTPEAFPKGKWASLQFLEALIDEAFK